jgi:hypothetical protein
MMTKKETDRAAEHDTISNKNCWPAANIFIRIGGGGISELFRALLYQWQMTEQLGEEEKKEKWKRDCWGVKVNWSPCLVWVSARLNGEKKWRNHLSRSVSAAA